ncbi:MAG TPA: glycosyltransferase family 1 protein, partial [Rhodospirillales bacterium]|nr:glycosyltransferase family 1 protein [Rhodospirillales bacterium]
TLARAKEINRSLALVWYCEDDMMNRRLRTRRLDGAIPFFDLWVTTKSFNARPDELPSLGAKNVLFVNNSCDPALHRPVSLDEGDRKRFGAPVSFIGSFEEPRAASMLYLARQGVSVRVWGNGWAPWAGRHSNLAIENKPVYNDDFARVVSASSINLCFLRRANRDLQTCRSIEIPACSGFMVHQRNGEIGALFREEKEAVYFSSDPELAEVCAAWLGRDQQRSRMGEAARKRTLDLELTHKSNIVRILNALPSRQSDGNR